MTSRDKIEKRDACELEKRKAQLNRKPLKFALFLPELQFF